MNELQVKALRRNLRKEYKTYMDVFKKETTLEDLLYNKETSKALAIVKEIHYFCMRDLDYNYNLIKKVYDIAYCNKFNVMFKNEYTFYSFLLVKAREIEDYNLLDWGGIIRFFKVIIEKYNYKTSQELINEVVKKYNLDYFKVLEDVDKALDNEFGFDNRKCLSEEMISRELYETILLSYKEEHEQ